MSDTSNTSNVNIINDPTVTNNTSVEFGDLTLDADDTLNKLYPIDDALMNYWYGEAGECFSVMANDIENGLLNLKLFTDNAYNVTKESVQYFTSADTEASNSLSVDSNNAGNSSSGDSSDEGDS